MNRKRRLSSEDIEAFEPDAKIALLATRDPEGRPHISLITSLAGKTPEQLMFGQFCEGQSKHNVRRDPRVGFLVMNLQRQFWRGRALWTHALMEGEDYEAYNRRPMFRYNSYFGIHTVHYLDLVDCSERAPLPMPGMIAGTLAATGLGGLLTLAGLAGGRARQPVPLNHWTHRLVNRMDTLKFLAYIDADGHPELVPVVPTRAVDRSRLLLVASVFRRELGAIPSGVPLALFAINLQMESVLLRGTASRFHGPPGLQAATFHGDWVYNSMPPKHGQVYPPPPLRAAGV
jgi:hypothetical protein